MRNILLTSLLLLAFSIPLFAQLTYTQYTTADGLCDNFLQAIEVDREGNVWVGGWSSPFSSNPGGVSCFDGTQWRSWWPWTTEWELCNQYITDIAVDSTNKVWFSLGFDPGPDSTYVLSTYKNDIWNKYNESDGLPARWVLNIEFSEYGTMWITTMSNGLFKYDGTSWINIEVTISNSYPLLIDREDNVWYKDTNMETVLVPV